METPGPPLEPEDRPMAVDVARVIDLGPGSGSDADTQAAFAWMAPAHPAPPATQAGRGGPP
eukprot:14168078-Alexandrium_andersonii.AAC.1